jgi:HAE1 family hydrophobic/amphiphilic exporter-1
VPWITIVTSYDGVAPEEIETLLTRPIERASSRVQGVDRIEATSAESISRVRLQFQWGTDLETALEDVRVAVDSVRAFLPEDAEPPNVFKFDLASVPVMSLGVTGTEDGRRLKFIAEDTLSRELERQPGVASVDVRGGRDREIRVELDPSRLAALGISATVVSDALQRENQTVSAGDMLGADRQVVIRTIGEFTSLEDIQNVVVATREGRPVRVADLGVVSDGIRRIKSELYINGKPGIEIRVFKQAGSNTVAVTEAVREQVERLNARYGERVQLEVISDASEYIRASVDGVKWSALIGAFLAVLVLLVFLRSVRAGLLAGRPGRQHREVAVRQRQVGQPGPTDHGRGQ